MGPSESHLEGPPPSALTTTCPGVRNVAGSSGNQRPSTQNAPCVSNRSVPRAPAGSAGRSRGARGSFTQAHCTDPSGVGNSLAVRWLALGAFTAEGLGSIPGHPWSGNCYPASCMAQPKQRGKDSLVSRGRGTRAAPRWFSAAVLTTAPRPALLSCSMAPVNCSPCSSLASVRTGPMSLRSGRSMNHHSSLVVGPSLQPQPARRGRGVTGEHPGWSSSGQQPREPLERMRVGLGVRRPGFHLLPNCVPAFTEPQSHRL